MRVLSWADMTSDDKAQLFGRGRDAFFTGPLKESIGKIIEDVRVNGDEAVCRALRDFDGVTVTPDQLRVTEAEMGEASLVIGGPMVKAISEMIASIRRFNQALMERLPDWSFESQPGLTVGQKVTPISSVGLFCPSGKASYPSVLAQIATPAVVAGVTKKVVITPPVPHTFGGLDPATLVVAQQLGITDIFRINGPAGVAAVAFGTEHIPRVVKVVGPGSPPVVCAQIEVQRYGCSTMMLLGPTEALIIADDSANPAWLAADLLNEAEHGTDSSVVLVTTSGALVERVEAELSVQLAALPVVRAEAAAASLGVNGGCVIVGNMAEASDVANAYGPEHMQIATAEPESILKMIHNAGEVLMGQHTTLSAANFMIGCPASLPTSGFSEVCGGITVEAFLKRTAVAYADESAMRRMAPTVIALADHEGFPAHANAQRIRLV